MDTRTTRMTSPEEKSRSSSNVAPKPGETWGEFYARLTPEELSDWYDDGLDGFRKLRAEKQQKQQKQEMPEPNATASTAPIIEDGKTLDELIAPNDALGQSLLRTLRARGATDQEIWQFMLDY